MDFKLDKDQTSLILELKVAMDFSRLNIFCAAQRTHVYESFSYLIDLFLPTKNTYFQEIAVKTIRIM